MLPFLGVLRTIWGAWNLLPGIIRGLIIGLIVAFISFHVGQRKQIRICEQQKEQSIAEARRIDNEANETARKRMESQNQQYLSQALDAENALNRAKDYYAKLPPQCKIDPEFIERNNSIGLGDGLQQLPSSKKEPARRK